MLHCIDPEGWTDGAINTPSQHMCVSVKVVCVVPVDSAGAYAGDVTVRDVL